MFPFLLSASFILSFGVWFGEHGDSLEPLHYLLVGLNIHVSTIVSSRRYFYMNKGVQVITIQQGLGTYIRAGKGY